MKQKIKKLKGRRRKPKTYRISDQAAKQMVEYVETWRGVDALLNFGGTRLQKICQEAYEAEQILKQ